MKNTSRLLATLSVCLAGAMFAATLATRPITAAGGNPSANLDQCANGTTSAPVPCSGSAWQNGNTNSGNSHWYEGDSIAYRIRFAGLTAGSTHYVTIQWDTTKGGKHALDYLTSYNRTETVGNDPCSGVAGCGSPTTFAIPPDTHTGLSLDPTQPSPENGRWNQVFTMFNGTITSVKIKDPALSNPEVPYNLTGAYSSDSSTSITITFTAASATPSLAWGGHVGNRKDWGAANSAVAITGSPYHMRVLDLDGSGGNQDRSTAGSAVIFPAILTITKSVVGSDGLNLYGSTPFNFAGTSPALNNVPEVDPSFTLVNDGVTPPAGTLPANQKQFKLFSFGTTGQVTITEGSTTGFQLTGLTCTATLNGVAEPNTNTVNLATSTATIVAAEGEEINCTYVNQQYATLTVIKSVVKTNGGTADAGSFTLRVTSTDGTNLAGPGSATGTVYSLAPGTYTVSEDVPPLTGYTQTGFSGDCDASGAVTLSLAGSKICTVTNHDVPGTLIVRKLVVNDGGGTKKASDFNFSLDGNVTSTAFNLDGDDSHGKNTLTKNAGTYTITEPAAAGYTTTYNNCSNVVLTNGGTQTCTITNDDQAGTLIVRKVVINDNGGTKKASDFSFSLDGNATSTAFALDGDDDHGKITLTKNAGTYTITEPPVVGYDTTYVACSNVVVGNGETKTCTITNNDQPAHLIIDKVVVNNNGGTLTAAASSGTIGGAVVATGGNTWSGASTDRTLTAVGSYNVAENAHPGYDATFSADCTGTIALGQTKTCTVTNDDQVAHLIVNKIVVNDNGGTVTPASFSGTIGGAVVAAGGNTWSGASTDRTLTMVGSYNVAENAHPGYDLTFSAGCTGTIAIGETRICTVTNDDQAAHLTLIKHVVNGNGGSATAGAFTLTASGAAVPGGSMLVPGTEAPGVTIEVNAGYYIITENSVSGYTQTGAVGCEGTLSNGGSATCTITTSDEKGDPGIQTTMSWRLMDSAAFTNFRTGAGQSAADATIVFKLYGPSAAKSCVDGGEGANLVHTETVTDVSSAGPFPTPTGRVVTVPGTYRWIATYSGDSFNNGKATQCGDETHTITVGEPPTTPLAQFIAPVNGATNVDITQPIQWTAVTGAQAYYLYVGSSLGAKDLLNSGELHGTSYLAASGLPVGQVLYARLWTEEADVWRYTDITFTAGGGGAPLVTATAITPASGATGVDPTGMIQWTAVPYAEKYYIYVGSTPGTNDLIDSQEICDGCVNSPIATSWSMTSAGKSPAQGLGGKAGQTVYLRIWTEFSGTWRSVDSAFTIAQ